MVKLGKFFSILVVLTLLILLAPAVILAPGGNIADAAGVVQEVEASFSFTESSGGAWYTFIAGENGISSTYGLGLTQFSRKNVVRSSALGTLAGCQYRNYTTAAGSVAGNLSGTISLAWETLKFNTPYPYTPKYNATAANGTNFGFITGKGIIDETGGDKFTFVFVADFDSDADMTNFAGKGFMLSVVENGTFAGHKIIGDFEISKNVTGYSGNFHLRNYDPSEVFDLGILNVTGSVLTEPTDNITKGLELVNFTADTSMSTPTDDFTDFEEIAWGKDPIKTVNFGHLGAGGKMDISRNTVLYLTYNPTGDMPPVIWVHIQGTAACNLLINDTYAVTGTDGSTHGKLWEFLLLSIPWQNVDVHTPAHYFHQSGYTFTPFGMLNASTESYAGTENFANAEIAIEATTVDAQQYSDDWAFGLYPHPKVQSITPSGGYVGETLNVTIKGKYFLRAGPDAPGGSWSIGPGITVNSWSLKNSSPLDNEIQACITIDPAAATTTRDVNVTACFNYENPAIRQYMTGILNGFKVYALKNATLQANANKLWVEPYVVSVFDNATHIEMGWSPINALSSAGGNLLISNLPAGIYDIAVHATDRTLSEVERNVTLALGALTVVPYTMRVGDSNKDDSITISDRTLLYGGWGTEEGDPGWRPYCDFNNDKSITISDRTLLYGQWGQEGDLLSYP